MKKKKEDMDRVLRDIGENGGFRVPDSYFDELPGRVMEKIRRGEVPASVPVAHMHRRRILSLAAAAVITLLFVTGFLLLQERNRSAREARATANVTAYLISGDFNEQTLYDFMEEENILPEMSAVTQDDDQIIDYLVNEGVDESLLAELY